MIRFIALIPSPLKGSMAGAYAMAGMIKG